MSEATEDGVELLGYMPWSAIDLIALSTGNIEKRYGFIYVDVENEGRGSYRRIRKDSFCWYKKVIASGGKNLDDGKTLTKSDRKRCAENYWFSASH